MVKPCALNSYLPMTAIEESGVYELQIIDNNGNIYLTMDYSREVIFDGITYQSNLLPGQTRFLLAQLDATGNSMDILIDVDGERGSARGGVVVNECTVLL